MWVYRHSSRDSVMSLKLYCYFSANLSELMFTVGSRIMKSVPGSTCEYSCQIYVENILLPPVCEPCFPS